MSIGHRWNDDALDEFIQCLQEFRRACGGPGLRELSRVSRQVVETQGRRYRSLQELSPTALSDVLNRRRKRPPSWSWLASFVLSCQRYAAESGLIAHDPGDSTLPEWNRRLQSLYAPGEHSPWRSAAGEAPSGNDHDGGHAGEPGGPRGPGATPPPAGPHGSEPLSAPTPHDAAPASDRAGHGGAAPGGPHRAAREAPIVELMADHLGEPGGPSLTELRLFGQYGRHGVDLLKAAEDQDPEACYRLGLLLCLDDRPTESLAWLMQAETHGHPRASRLIEHPAPRTMAPADAHEIGAQAAVAGDHATAQIYLERAAAAGHASSAFELGALWMERHDPEGAVYWFTRAAESGHPLAEWWSDKIHSETGREGAPPSAPGASASVRTVRTTALPTVAELIARIDAAHTGAE